jgi:hypothetical protein
MIVEDQICRVVSSLSVTGLEATTKILFRPSVVASGNLSVRIIIIVFSRVWISRFQNSAFSRAIVSLECVSGGYWPVRPNRNRTVNHQHEENWCYAHGIFDYRQKIAAARMPNTMPISGLSSANQKETFQPDFWAIEFVFTLFSQVFEDQHFTEREMSLGTLNEQENQDRRVWTRGLGENATWLWPHHDFRAGSASHRYPASKIATHSALSLWRRSPPLLEIEA